MYRLLFIVTAGAVALSTSAAFAGGKDCACKPHWKRHHVRVYKPPMPPVYVVNQGPVVSGPMLYTYPTYSAHGRVYRVGYGVSVPANYAYYTGYRPPGSVLPKARFVPLPAN